MGEERKLEIKSLSWVIIPVLAGIVLGYLVGSLLKHPIAGFIAGAIAGALAIPAEGMNAQSWE